MDSPLIPLDHIFHFTLDRENWVINILKAVYFMHYIYRGRDTEGGLDPLIYYIKYKYPANRDRLN